MIEDFKKFIMRGNVLDMAVGIIIGAAFGSIVNSLVADVIMPPIGLILGNVDFSNLFLVLRDGAKAAGPYASLAAAKAAGAVTVNVGVFINTLISFLIVALAVFLLLRNINKLYKKQEARSPHHQGLPLLPDERPDQSHPLRTLHFGIESILTRPKFIRRSKEDDLVKSRRNDGFDCRGVRPDAHFLGRAPARPYNARRAKTEE